MNLYTIVFEDNSVFEGGTIETTLWMKIPNKKIRSIFYNIPLGDCIGLSGYNSYYHFVETTVDLSGENKGQVQVEYTYLLGKKENQYKVYKINIKTGQIEIKIIDNNDNFIKQLNPQGWK